MTLDRHSEKSLSVAQCPSWAKRTHTLDGTDAMRSILWYTKSLFRNTIHAEPTIP